MTRLRGFQVRIEHFDALKRIDVVDQARWIGRHVQNLQLFDRIEELD